MLAKETVTVQLKGNCE
ncbi:hypothetical protein R3I93_017453 [Phoxinus phoxinus]|uniref:Uncharacterized protein n=1 Tax=Phoxinus phoxinus TaxID=58324 RepID=A0AAN9CIF5_9TELE